MIPASIPALLAILVCVLFVFLVTRCTRHSSAPLRGKSVVVTGAARGIGAETAIQLAKRGAVLHLWDIDIGGIDQFRSALMELGAQAVHVSQVDVSDACSVAAAANSILQHTDISAVISNAAVMNGRDIDCLTSEDVHRSLSVNIGASFNLLRAFLPSMKRSTGGGTCLFVSSAMAYVGAAGLSDYCASKAALVALAESLRFELARDGLRNHVKVVIVCPYHVGDTDMFRGSLPHDCCTLRGCLFSSLRARNVASTIVDAASAGRNAVISLPWHAYYALWFAHGLLPLWASDELLGRSGGWHGLQGSRVQSQRSQARLPN